MRPAAAIAVAASLAYLATPVAGRIAHTLGILDHPGPLKVQRQPIPYLGGVGVFAGVAVGAALGRPWLVLPLIMALVLGTADDAIDLPPLVRLACECGVGLAVAATAQLGAGLTWPLLAVLATPALINAINLIDGLDALASGVTLGAAAGFCALLSGDARLLALSLVGAALGFLFWNRPPARIYLGDGGAYLLGTCLAVLLAATWRPGVTVSYRAAGLVIVALPGLELGCSIVRRARARTSLLKGDRGHGYDRLVQRGWSPLTASGSYVAAEALISALAAGVARLPNSWSLAAAAGVGGMLAVVAAAGRFLAPAQEPAE